MAQIKINSFLILEQAFTKRLQKSWQKTSVNLFTRLTKAINAEDWTRVDIIIDSIDFGVTLKSNQRFMEFIGRGAFLFGVGRHGDIKESQFIKEKKKIPFIRDASENLQAIISEQGTLFIKGNIRKAVSIIKSRTNQAKVTKALKVRSNADLLKNSIGGKTDQYLENVSSLHNSRLAGWGYVKEAEALGYTTYSVSEQIDSDTICPICISMHGKTFKVKQVAKRLETLLTVDNLNDMKHMAPWPNQSKAGVQKFRNLSNDELVASGFQHPPYHPRCRGLLVRSDDTASLAPISAANARRIPRPARLPIVPPIRPIPGMPRRRFLPIKSLDAEKLMKKDFKALQSTLSTVEIEILEKYGTSKYRAINGFMRGSVSQKVLNKRKLGDAPGILKAVFDKPEAILTRDVVVFRGINSKTLATQIQKGNLVGSILEDKGFMSTSFNKSAALEFLSPERGVLIEIRIPKGLKQSAIPVEAIGIEKLVFENELLLPPDVKLRVIKVIKETKTIRKTIVVEVVL